MFKKNSVKKFIIFSSAIFLSGCIPRGCNKNQANLDCKAIKGERVELTYWRVFDDSSIMDPIIEKYVEDYPWVDIKVEKINSENYYDSLKTALGSVNNRPDIVQVRSDWYSEFRDAFFPSNPREWDEKLQSDLTTSFREKMYCWYGNEAWLTQSLPEYLTIKEVKQNFSPMVVKDTIIEEKVFGTALYVEPLGLFYNKKLFAKAGIENPPKTWEEFAEIARKITEDENGKHPGEVGFNPVKLKISGSAFGDSQIGVNRASDIIASLFMQQGIEMVDNTSTKATFNQGRGRREPKDVLDFYTSFTDPKSINYSWDPGFLDGVGGDEAFRLGKVGMIINYPHKLDKGETNYWDGINSADPDTGLTPRFDLGVAELPYFSDGIQLTYGSYFGEAVSSQKHPSESWEFLRYLTGLDEERIEDAPVWIYSSKTNLPASRIGKEYLEYQTQIPYSDFEDRIDRNNSEPLLKNFARQVVKSVGYQRSNPIKIEDALSDMILSNMKYKNPLLRVKKTITPLTSEEAVNFYSKEVSDLLAR
ncbi:MAG: hypothetical protein Fur0024_0200 [Patescibacteria group bacterium]